MAAIAKVSENSPIFVAPPGMEVIDKGYALDAIRAGDPIIIDPTAAPSRAYDCAVRKATGTVAHGLALKPVSAGGTCEFAMQGEMDGFAGLTPGAALTVVAGALDNTAPAAGATAQIRVVNASRIRFVLV